MIVWFSLSLCASFVGAQTSDKLAEGFYKVSEDPMHKATGIHWEMTKGTDGGFVIERTRIGKSGPGNIVQQFGFTGDWKPISYSMRVAPNGAVQTSAYSLVCQYRLAAVSCDAVIKGIETRSSLTVTGPRVIIPPGFVIDVFWMMATTCSQAERTPGKVTNIAEVSMVDDHNSSAMKLGILETLPVAYIGQEDLKTALGTTRAHKFRIQNMTVWTAESGLLLAMTPEGSDGGERIDLSVLNDTTNRLLPVPIQK
jgi:hypothetical protein